MTRTWPRKEGDQKLNRLEERLAHVKRNGQRVIMLPQRESTRSEAEMSARNHKQKEPRAVLTDRLGR